VLFVTVLATFAFAAAGCGKSEEEKKSEAAAAQTGRGELTCEGSAMSSDAGLPDNFPVLDEVTIVSAEDNGPTHVVNGYGDDEIEGMYREWKDRLQEEQYKILFDELEDKDSEISYETNDGTKEGIIALRTCDNDKVSVHITSRAAA
jgi:hypothetical protein